MKTIDFSYFIERYNAGEMDQTEKTWFEKELEGNESLQKEVLLRKKSDLILERNDIISLRNKLNLIEKSRKDEMVKPEILKTPRFRHNEMAKPEILKTPRFRYNEMAKSVILKTPRFRYAAIFAGLIMFGSLLFFSFKNQSPDTIYKRYYQVYENPGTSRSGEASYAEAINYFNKREFGKALEGFKVYLKNNPGSAQYEFLSGVSNMEIRNFTDAELSFNKVINREVNFYKEDANWYLAMCYLATSDKVMARNQFRNIAESESIYKKKARKILRHL